MTYIKSIITDHADQHQRGLLFLRTNMRKTRYKRRSAVGFTSVKIKICKTRKDNMVIIMTKNYFKVKAAMKAVNAKLRKAHPDWDNKRVYAATKAMVLK